MPIGAYLVDFVCFEKHLVIELDGGLHLNNQIDDKNRSDWLKAQGFQVVRFWNNDVVQQTASVINVILNTLTENNPGPSTLKPVVYSRTGHQSDTFWPFYHIVPQLF